MKYLMLDHGGVLDGSVMLDTPSADDLILDNYDSEDGQPCRQVLRHGVSIVRTMNELLQNHGYQVVFHSSNTEEDQLRILNQLQAACRQKNLEFPPVTAMAVLNKEHKAVNSQNPIIITDRPHGIKIATYGVGKDGKSCIREALSALLDIPADKREESIVFDDGKSVIETALAEGYQAIRIGNLHAALRKTLEMEHKLREAKSHSNESKESPEYKTSIPKPETIEKAHQKLLKLTRAYSSTDLIAAEKNHIRELLNILEDPQQPKYQRLENFAKRVVQPNNFQQQSSNWQRYCKVALSIILGVLPAVLWMVQSYNRYGTVCFWKPEREKIKHCALKECGKMNIRLG